MRFLLVITYIVFALWISGGVFYWIFKCGKRYPSIVYRRVESFFVTLGAISLLLFICWCIAWHIRHVVSIEERSREHAVALRAARESFENTYTNVFELLRERNRRELELRLDYDLRVARMIEDINSNSFSVMDSPCESVPNVPYLWILIFNLRKDINLIKRTLKSEEDFPLSPFSLAPNSSIIEGGAVQFQQDDLLQSD